MPTILDKILREKEKEVKILKENAHNMIRSRHHPQHSLIEKLNNTDQLLVISEFKRASPSKGLMNGTVDPLEQATAYVKNGATAVSVLTDEKFFHGSFADLQLIRDNVAVPILCKDFIIDEIQIDLAHDAGADMILLIVAALSKDRLKNLYDYAKEKQLEVLVEVHEENELEKAFHTGAKMIGVNNRNLKTFHVDIHTTERLAPNILANGSHLISESGLTTVEDLKRVVAAGAEGVLIGEAFMKQRHPAKLIHCFSQISLAGTNK